VTRPQRPVSQETQAAIAAGLDESAESAEAHGYPETAQNLREKAANYRAATGQTDPGQSGAGQAAD
jgi:GH15 family glucan-1,4-alpha-glucosidase